MRVAIPNRVDEYTKGRKVFLKSFSELYERVAGTGLVVPQVLEIEQSVLGAMMIDKSAVRRVMDTIGDRESPFYRDAHTSIYHAITKLFGSGEEVDLLSVTQRLRLEGELEEAGGPAYLVELTSKVVTTANVEAHTRLIVEKSLARELISTCEVLKLRAFLGEEDTFEILTDAEKVIFRLSETRHQGAPTWRSMEQLSDDVLTIIQENAKRGFEVIGVPSELADLDRMTNGWQAGKLIVLGARPSQGKTALAMIFARNPAFSRGVPVGIFSLETGGPDLMKRLIAAESGLNLSAVTKGKLEPGEWVRYKEADARLRQANIFIDETYSLTAKQLSSKARQLKLRENIGLIIIDYVQLMEGSGNDREREREVAKISRSLKGLAKELSIPIIALSQLNRDVEKRADRRPMLSDLRESGSLEQDADVVMLLYRPETYGIAQWAYPFADSKPTEGMAEIIIAKQKDGPIGSVRVKFEATCGDFNDHIFIPDFDNQEEIF